MAKKNYKYGMQSIDLLRWGVENDVKTLKAQKWTVFVDLLPTATSLIILFIILIIFTACNGQEKTNIPHNTPAPQPNPIVIKNFMSATAPSDFDTTLVSQYIRSIFQDSKGNLWFGTIAEGVVRYDVKTLTYYSNHDGFINNTVYAINEDKNGHLWLGTDLGVYKYDGATFRNYSQKEGLSHIDITRKGILVDRSGTIWVGTHGGVFQYNPSADSIGGQCFSLFQQLPPVNIAGIMEDHNGHIWFATTQNGVFCYNPSASASAGEKVITHITEKEGLGDNYAGGMAEDKEGNIWFTMKNGICKYDPSAVHKPVRERITEYTAKDGLGGTEFWGIYIEQSGIIWITARGCTTRFDPTIPLPNPQAFTLFTPENGLNCCVQSMYQDKSGNMWWGTGQGLYRFNGQQFYLVKKNGPW